MQVAIGTLIKDIEKHLEQSLTAEAISRCLHVLRHFPKHIQTYNLMGEAFLQQGDFDGAFNLYRRVLSADPEHVDAYIALAKIHDYRHQLEEAVWHMERAYELMPGDPAIRKELLRLLQQFDGISRERLKLTPGALAHLYAREGHFPQAIHELREIASTTLSRYDARVALAETLWRAGQTRESAEVAQRLLDSLPYCLKANLILGTAWRESGIQESEVYLQRAQSLDPSNQIAHNLLGARSPLRPVQAMLPGFEDGRAIAPDETPHIETVAGEPEPSQEEQAAVSFFAETTATEALPTLIDDLISQPIEEVESSSAGAAEQRRPSDLPEWLVMEEETVNAPRADFIEERLPAETEPPVWLKELQRTFSEESEDGVPAERVPMPEAKPPPAALSETTPPPVTVEETRASEPIEPESVPDWLAESPIEMTTEEPPAPVEEVPDWLREPTTPEAEPSQVESGREEPVTEAKVPKWVQVLSEHKEEQRTLAVEPVEDDFSQPAGLTETYEIEQQSQLEPPTPPPALEEAPRAPRKAKRQPRYYSRLVQAREHMAAARWTDALAEYDFLTQKAPRLAKEVIADLEGWVARADAPLDAHRILGDAFTRDGQLNEALERYRFVYKRVAESSP